MVYCLTVELILVIMGVWWWWLGEVPRGALAA
jgi:hypothetical protein